MNDQGKRYRVLDTETGEIIESQLTDEIIESKKRIVEVEEGDRILRGSSLKAIEGQVLNFNKGHSFLKMYDDSMKRIRGLLSNAQFSFVCHLLPQVEYDTNVLRNDDGSIMELKHIQAITQQTYESNRRQMLSLIGLGIIGRWEVGDKDRPKIRHECFVMNPYIFHKGVNIYAGLLDLFSKAGWKK